MLKNLSPFLKALAAFTIAIILANLAQNYIRQSATDIASYYKPTELTDIDNRNTNNVFHAGQAVIGHFFIERTSLQCYADYYETLDGPVSVQFGHARSVAVYANYVKRELRYLYTIPANLPPGKYVWRHLSFPICDDTRLKPMSKEIGTITIVK